jgi:hypothetical protein
VVVGTTAANLGKMAYTAKFTDDTPVPDLGWSEDSSGNVSLVNGDASTIDFSNLGFFVSPSGILTAGQIDAFIAGTLPLTPGSVTSGDVPADGSLFVGSFSPGAALLAGFDAQYQDMTFSPVTAADGLGTAFDIVPEPPAVVLVVTSISLFTFVRRISRQSRARARRLDDALAADIDVSRSTRQGNGEDDESDRRLPLRADHLRS